MVSNMVRASDELAKAATSLQSLAAQESPTVQNTNIALKEISRAADALRRLAELLEQQMLFIVESVRRESNEGSVAKWEPVL